MVLDDACSRLFSMGMESVLALLFKKRFRNFRPASQPAQPFRTENAAKWRQFARQARVHGIDLGMYGVRQKDGTKNIWDERASRPASQPAIPDEVSRNEKKNFALKVPESQKILKSQKGPAHKARTELQWPSAWAQTCGPPYEAAIPQTHSHTNRAGHVYSRCRNVLLQQGSRVFRACTKASWPLRLVSAVDSTRTAGFSPRSSLAWLRIFG